MSRSYRILSTAQNLPGPLAMARLRGMGMTITRIEGPSGDLLKTSYPDWYNRLHQEIELVTLDLRKDKVRFETLLKSFDLVVTSQRPEFLKSVGLDLKTLSSTHPNLKVLHLFGYPSPHENVPAHDLNLLHQYHLTEKKFLPKGLFVDFLAAEKLVSSALYLLLSSAKSKTVTLAEAALELAEPYRHGATSPSGPLGGGNPFYNLYDSKDGVIGVALLEPSLQEQFVTHFNLQQVTGAILADLFKTMTSSEWHSLGQRLALPITAG